MLVSCGVSLMRLVWRMCWLVCVVLVIVWWWIVDVLVWVELVYCGVDVVDGVVGDCDGDF